MTEKCRLLYGLEASDGGSLKHLVYLIYNLDKNLFDITVILSDRRSNRIYGVIEKLKKAGVKVIVVPMERRISLFRDTVSFITIYRHIAGNRYDIVHAHSSKAGALFGLAAWLNRVPCIIYTPHCFYSQAL
jgi:hypothetical protein